MIPKFVSELRNLNHTRFNSLVARLSLKFADEFQGRATRTRRPAVLLLAALLTLGTARLAAAAEQLDIGGKYGTIDFAIGNSKVFRTTGSFTDWKGTVKVDDTDVPQSSVDVVIKTTSIQMLDEQQTNMLKDADYFDVQHFPEMSFHSTHIERTGQDTLKVQGEVTLRGITRPMILAVTVSDRRPDAAPGARYARFRGVGTIKRSEFGMTKYLDMVGDNVEISIATEARRR
jgi:polyisoprenoid-binding protein YceI